MTRFVQLCAQYEGYGKPGTIPTRDNNPMDLRHSPHSEHPDDPDAIGVIDTAADGFADAERQARLWANRGLTLGEAVWTLAPPQENNTEAYLEFVLQGLGNGITAESRMLEVLTIQAV